MLNEFEGRKPPAPPNEFAAPVGLLLPKANVWGAVKVLDVYTGGPPNRDALVVA